MTEESRNEFQEAAEEVEAMSVEEALEGLADVAGGLDELEAADELESVSRAALAAGASDVTRGVDAMKVADRVDC